MALSNDPRAELLKIEKQREARAAHFIGVAGLLLFLKDNNALNELEKPLIHFPIEALDLLYLCIPKEAIHPCPVIGCEEIIWRWFSKLDIKGIIIQKNDVVFLTNNVKGDSFSADFNPIGIKIFTNQIFNIAEEWKAFDIALVSHGIPVKSTTKRIPIIGLPSGGQSIEEWLIENQKGSSQLELTLRKIRSQNAYENVAFKGDAPISGEFRQLVAPFDPSKVPKVQSDRYE